MLSILKHRTYRHLFLAQIIALLGTGLATVALGLMAYDLNPENAAFILGVIFTIKMVAYVGIAPIAGVFAERLNRRFLLVALDLVRAVAMLCLPFATQVWQAYALIFLMQSASAAFTPTFQATIPDVLPDEAEYTRALSLSRLAYDLENILSPTFAALLLLLFSYNILFVCAFSGFVASALLVLTVTLPDPKPSEPRGVYDRTTRGIRIYLATPRLRGLMGLNLAVSGAGAMVLVNTVVLVRGELGLGDSALAWTMFAFGLGSMIAALTLPRRLEKAADRPIMAKGATMMCLGLLALAISITVVGLNWPILAAAWMIIGLGYSSVLTPAGRLLARSAHPEDRPAVFAAQFALSHAGWLLCYPLAGWLMTYYGVIPSLLVLAVLSGSALLIAMRLWPADDPIEVAHTHENLPNDHPHLRGHPQHSHPMIIDDLHPQWGIGR